MHHKALKSHFSLSENFDFESIYPYSPVYKGTLAGTSTEIILKKTRSPLKKARDIQTWLTHLTSAGVNCVEALDVQAPNPFTFEQDVWVAYPFIAGHHYTALSQEIKSAGQLLGRIHQAGQTHLPDYTWGNPDEIDEDWKALQQLTSKGVATQDIQALKPYFDNYATHLKQLQEADLPWISGTWDYKANNLIYTPQGPVLIDPDSAGRLPRLLDLALAVILFHNELASAPGRLFTQTEWHLFQEGYFSQVTLNHFEHQMWPLALKYMYLEEAVWLLLSDDEGWQTKPQSDFLHALCRLPDHPHLFEFHKLK